MMARPSVGTIMVERMRKRVDLPPPFGPSRPKISPLLHLEADVRKRDAVAVAMGEILNLRSQTGPVEQHQPVDERKVSTTVISTPRARTQIVRSSATRTPEYRNQRPSSERADQVDAARHAEQGRRPG